MIRAPLACSLALLALVAPMTAQNAPQPDARARVVPGRSVVHTRYGIVATSSPLASSAGVQILEQGGNAIDAAIAANAVLGLVEPTSNGIGGDLFAIVYEAKSGKLFGLNASGWSATGQSAEAMRARGIDAMPFRSVETITVPGAVAGWDALRERFGALGFDRLLAPAIRYAEEGFPVAEVTARGWRASEPLLRGQDAAAATFLVNGRAPAEGELFRNPGLARTLRRIAEKGRDGFYRGPTADAVVALVRGAGGTMIAADLAEFTAEWVTPISTTYRGWTVSELPPNGQGIAALLMLDLMAHHPLGEWGLHDPRGLHVMIEAKKLAYADMLRYVGDPRFGEIPVATLLDPSRTAERARRIDPARAQCRVEPTQLAGVSDMKGHDTIYLSTIDAEGNIVSLIQSNYAGFGSGFVAAGTGFMLQNRGALFTLEPGHPNTLAPRKRPLHTIIPGFMAKGDVRIGFGIMGGWNQAQAHAQFVSNVVDHGLSIQQALEAGRFTKPTFEGCDVLVEDRVPAASRDALRPLGHEVTVPRPRSGEFGFGQAVRDDGHGVHSGASDPRHDGAAIPQPVPLGKR
ncbi:MAG TPA: gamma-glutamyltransferase family protein [Gemmatimonadales bacterium]|nr:gamma-glutamyltransferase family protein [Gemmatimonadales bacterium]